MAEFEPLTGGGEVQTDVEVNGDPYYDTVTVSEENNKISVSVSTYNVWETKESHETTQRRIKWMPDFFNNYGVDYPDQFDSNTRLKVVNTDGDGASFDTYISNFVGGDSYYYDGQSFSTEDGSLIVNKINVKRGYGFGGFGIGPGLRMEYQEREMRTSVDNVEVR